ncbi:MAG TPA: ComF family protein [Bacteroidales bacterium]|jgi:ComF family protein|nr:ComF family protein [Bacteroidales bacterium]
MKRLLDILDDFASLLFPRICYGCGNHLMRNEKVICTDCHVQIPRTSYHTEPDNPVARLFWGRCLITRAAAFSYYNRGSRIRALIHNLKYRGIKEAGTELGRIYGFALKESGFTNGMDLIIPVPLHPARERERGYNQSSIIAEGIAEATELGVDDKILVRSVKSKTQTKRSRYERWTNVEGIFIVVQPERITGKHILLVDDVITTGSTIESCANELLKYEGVKVSVAALACAVM